MVVPRQLLLVRRGDLLRVVAAAVLLQRDAGVVPSVRDGSHHGPASRPAGSEAPEGGAQGKAPRGVRAWDRHWGAGALGGAPVRRRTLPQAPLGWNLRRGLQEVAKTTPFIYFYLSALGFSSYLDSIQNLDFQDSRLLREARKE